VGAAGAPWLALRGARATRITRFAAVPATAPAAGGSVRLLADVKNGKVCTFRSTSGSKAIGTRSCSSGAASVTVKIARNTRGATKTYRYTVLVRGTHGSATASVLVSQPGEAAPSATAPASTSPATSTPTVTTTPATSATAPVTSAPAITAQPASASVTSGTSVTFSAAAAGTPTPTVQWQVSTDGGSTWSAVSGATTTSYTLSATSTAESGYEYRAVFTNSAGSATTAAATLTVSASVTSGTAPSVLGQPVSETVQAGTSATFSADGYGVPTPSVQWQVSTNGGSSWSNAPGATATSATSDTPDSNGTTYNVTALASDSGNEYRAVFTNGVSPSATTNPVTLTVTGTAPSTTATSITSEPASDQVTSAAATATFTAAASGTPTPTVQWQVSTNGGSSWSTVAGATSPTYSFVATASDSANEYRARFTNSVSSATTNAATLTWTNVGGPSNGAPTVTVQPVSQAAVAGLASEYSSASVATFTAAASGTPTPTAQWQVSTNGGVTWTNVSGATSATYSFPAVQSDNGNEYRAVFTNGVGSVTTSPAQLTMDTSDLESGENWSGYVATGTKFTSVSGSWTVPSIVCTGDETNFSSQWIGIDGNTNDTVEQDGTEAECKAGTPFYYAWYEMLGDSAVDDGYAVALPTGTGQYPVSPGDVMTASVSFAAGVWTLTIADSTHPWSGGALSVNFAWSTAAQSSAEWIVERTYVGYYPSLSDFASVTFTHATASDASTSGGIGAFSFAPDWMASSLDVLAGPGALSESYGSSFTDTWYSSD
jgi:hypothetical protein